jgi:hypothetical protein
MRVEDRIIARLRVNTPNSHAIPGWHDAHGHQVYECSERDNVYCPICDTFYDPKDLKR